MPLTSIKLRPGLFSVLTPTLNETGWQEASNVRFFEGMAQKDAGFVTLIDDAALGPVRALKGWTAIDTTDYLGIGGQVRLKVWDGTTLTDISPLGLIQKNTVSLDNWGEFLMACYKGGPVYVWQPSLGGLAQNIATAPQQSNFIFIAIQQRQLICCGTEDALGNFDPMLLRWSDTDDYTNFTPATDNQAGSFRLPIGSEIRAGLTIGGQNLIWTDITVYSMNYIQFPLVWGFQPLGLNCGAVGPHSVGILGGKVYWMGANQFFSITPSGDPAPLICPVWDQVFANVDRDALYETPCETDSYYGEVGWTVKQLDGTYVRARLQIETSAWTASAYHPTTAWIDQNPFGPPIAGHATGVVDQHDIGFDADGEAAPWSLTSGIIMIAEGEETTFVSDVIPDFKTTGNPTISVTVKYYDYPDKAPRVKGPYLVTGDTQVIHPRGRGRGVQFVFSGNDLGTSVRLGNIRYRGQPDGKR